MSDEFSLGSRINPPGMKPIELQHWSTLPWSEAKSLNEFYKLANDKQSHIMISDVVIDLETLGTLATYISSATTIVGICFSNNNLGDNGLRDMLAAIYEYGGRQIETLAVIKNGLTVVSAKYVGKIIGSGICNIRRLSLAHNNLRDNFAKSFVKFLKFNDSIFELDLADSHISFAGIAMLVKVFKFNTKLLQFHMENKPNSIEANKAPDLTNLEMYSTRLLNHTKAGRKMKPKKKEAMSRLIKLTNKCITRNLRIRYAKSRCADILRKGSYPVRLQVARISLVGAEKSGKTGVAHALLDKCPMYYPNHNPTISLATAVLQTFQPESVEFDEMLKNINPDLVLEKKDKYYSRRAQIPFDSLSVPDDIEAVKKKGKRLQPVGDMQIWRATRRNFDGMVAMSAHRESSQAAFAAETFDDDSVEVAGKTLYTNPASINPRIEELAPRYAMYAVHLDNASVILPRMQLDQLSTGSWNPEVGEETADLGATLAVATKSHEQVMRMSFLFDDVDSEVTLNTKRDNETMADLDDKSRFGGSRNGGGSHVAASKYKNYKKSKDMKMAEGLAPKISTIMNDNQSDALVWNPMVSEMGLRDIASDDILFRSHFADTCIFNLFDLGGGLLAQMLTKFAITKDGINTVVFDMERAAKADLGMSDVIREELTMWYRCIELFAGEDPTVLVVGTGSDILDRLASNNVVTDKKTDFGRLNAGATGNTMKRQKGYTKEASAVVRNILQSLNKDIVLSVVRDDNKNLILNEEGELAFFPVSNLYIQGIDPIKLVMEQHARKLGSQLEYHVPLRWLKFLELAFAKYSESPDVHYRLTSKSALQLAKSVGFTCKKEVELCLQKFDQLGFLQYNGYTLELAKWIILDPIPIYKSLLKFANNHRIDLELSPAQAKLEEKFGNELILLRNHGLLRKQLFKLLWQGGKEKNDLNFGVKWLTEHYFMTEFLLDGERLFFFPCFLRGPEHFQKVSPMVEAPKERFFFAISFNPTGFMPPALLPRLIALLFGASIQENFINSAHPLKSGGDLHPEYNLFSKTNTQSLVYLSKEYIRIQLGGQLVSMTMEGNELTFGLSQEDFANRIVLVIHSMLSRLNSDVFFGRLLWDIIFFQNLMTSRNFGHARQQHGSYIPAPPPRNGRYRPPAPQSVYSNNRSVVHSTFGGNSHLSNDGSEGLVAYESDEDDETIVGVAGRRVRLSFNEARSKKLRPFFSNEMDDYEACHELWKGARNSAEARQHFSQQTVPENVEDFCNRLRKKYLTNSF